jgi:formylglycine-generating enzyme required for sulfatase activity/serine/threonine protein kinase
MFARFLKCVAKAALDNAPKALLGLFMPAVANALWDIAGDVVKNWKEQTPRPDERRAEVQALAAAPAAEVRRQAEEAVAAVAADQPEPLRRSLVTYLTQLPGAVRRSLRRVDDPTGATVPAQLPLDKPEDVLPFLPTRLPRFQPGDRVGGCQLEELLGVGGFGEVWKASDPRRPGPVALKFCTDPTAARVLRNEAALLARVTEYGRHPGIVALLDSCLSNDPPYLEYEYVAGGDFGRVIRNWKRLSPPERLERSIQMMRRLAEIVAFAHAQGIVHRDLKPANILLKPTDKGNFLLRVTDFGIGGTAADQARGQTGADRTRGSRMTELLRGAFTPLYASPQQIKGERPDPRDDVHALGVIWYQTLTGEPSAAASADWREELTEKQVPEEVLNLLGRCMAAKAERRPADAGALTKELSTLRERTGPTPAWLPDMLDASPGGPSAPPLPITPDMLDAPPSLPPAGPAKAIPTGRTGRPDVRSETWLGWVWIAAGAAALVLAVLIVFAVRSLSKPKATDGSPVATTPPRDADTSRAADTTKDTAKAMHADTNRKKDEADKTDRTDTLLRPPPQPRLLAFPKLSLPARGAAALQVKVDRRGYVGPVELRFGSLPAGVTCQQPATISAGESSVRIEFRTDGTAAEGTPTVNVIALADARAADQQQLSFVIPPQPPPDQFKNGLGMEFVRIPKGKSWLGGGGGKPGDREFEIAHDFYLGKFLVTQEEWQNLMRANPSWFSRTGPGKDAVQGVSDEELKRFPVENVSWFDAQLFLAELNKRAKESGWVYRLPTDAEWEYACRGGPLVDKRDSAFDYYLHKPTNVLLPGLANFHRDDGLKRPCKVGAYPPNPLGLYDMHGNVWEWCHDAQINRESLRIMRGGSHTAQVEGCSASNRPDRPPQSRNGDAGLRVARVPVSPEKK